MATTSRRGLSVISSIKCSTCGKAIPLNSLPDHVCDAAIGPPVPKQGTGNDQYSDFSSKNLPDVPTLPAPGYNRWNAEPPPKIDPVVANQFRSFDKFSSASSRDYRSPSPLTASTQYTSPDSLYSRGKPSRTPSPPSPFTSASNSAFGEPGPNEFLRKNSEPILDRKNMIADGPFGAVPRQNTFPGPGPARLGPPQGRVSPLDPQWKFRNEKGREHIRMMGRTPSPPVGSYGNQLPPTPDSRNRPRLDSRNDGREAPGFNRMPPASNSPQRLPPSDSPRRNGPYPPYQPRPRDEPDVSPRGMPPRRPVDPYAVRQPPPKWQPDLYQRNNQRNDEPFRGPPRVLPNADAPRSDRLPVADPAVQIGLDDGMLERSRSDPEKEMPRNDGRRAMPQQEHRGFMSRSPQSSPEPTAPSPVAQHSCRGCSAPIEGRSLKDSSGRLTGRYHRDCFRCTTCAQPFPSGDFYVLADQPYCALHYHERNGSCCRGCHIGIEGAYLETDDRRIYHPACFRCDSCGSALAEEYWELDGRTLCHRHNFGSPGAGGAAGGPQKYPERRRTKMVTNAKGGAGRRPFF